MPEPVFNTSINAAASRAQINVYDGLSIVAMVVCSREAENSNNAYIKLREAVRRIF